MTKKCYEKLLLSLYMLLIFFGGCLVLYLVSSGLKNDLFSNDITISMGVIFIVFSILYFIVVIIDIFNSIRNHSKHKNSTKNNNPTSTSVQSNTETCNMVTRSISKTTSFDVKPTKQYPVLGEIQNIISNLMELENNQDLDKDLFVEFHVLKDKFNSDHQEIVKMLNTLGEIDQLDDNHLKPFNHYLDAFKKQQQIIYGNIKQQYNDKLNTISEQLQHFNKIK